MHLIDFGYNIHHGPGMAWAIKNLPLSGPVLFLDSDIEIVRAGFIEELLKSLTPEMYGVGAVNCINRDGFNVDDSIDGIRCLIPMCMLCNIEVMRQWPLPIKHGMPMTATMLALHDSHASHLIKNIDWVMNDIITGTKKYLLITKVPAPSLKQGDTILKSGHKKCNKKLPSQKKILSI